MEISPPLPNQFGFNLRDNNIPVLTTERVSLRDVVEELLWSIKGSTDTLLLKKEGVHVWDQFGSKELNLDKRGLGNREEGDLGPVHGFQWRHFGAEYESKKHEYTGQGVDQLVDIIERIKKNPYDRRLILTAWNPKDVPIMAVAPSHCLCQFYVNDNEISCHLYQRSANAHLGVAFNLASYSILTHMIAHLTNLKPGEVWLTIGDAQLPDELSEPLQIVKTAKSFEISFNRKVDSIDDFKYDDLEVSSKDRLSIVLYRGRSKEDNADLTYFSFLDCILNEGKFKPDRTGTGTVSLFVVQMRFNLREDRIPLLTTKRVFWRGVVEELLWFIKASTDSNSLKDKKVHIWDSNGSRDFLDKSGLSYREEGDLGPVYGFQWRHFGAEYKDKTHDYTGEGLDQLADIIERIKKNPNDKELILTAWNPEDVPIMALPPCHCFSQFYVYNGELSCHLYQRSADFGLGVPFNIASYSLLTHMIAHLTNLKPGEFVHSIGDAHIYKDHVEPLRQQMERKPSECPRIQFKRRVDSIDDFKYDDFELLNYDPQASIAMKMSV